MTLSQQQNEALELIKKFAGGKDGSVFILKGYAGTGKTTLIKELVRVLSDSGKRVTLMAPTGRATKILQEKTGYDACTIHRGIYAFECMRAVRYDENGNMIITNHTEEDTQRSKGSDDLQFWFGIKKHDQDYDPSQNIYIIDESSMISSRPSKNEQLHFGTDILMEDLLTYVQPHLGGKVIFVGDPAQLPPVGDNHSAALETAYFEERELKVSQYELTEVLRQNSGNAILKNAMMIRDVLKCSPDTRNHLCFDRREEEVIDMTSEEVLDSFYENNPHPMIGDSVIICYTNAAVKDYNDAIRRRYFPANKEIVAGDILQVVKNNINTHLGIEYLNGDFVRVLQVSSEVETFKTPVWTDKNGERERVNISIDFRDATLQKEDGSQTSCKIIDSLLNSREPNLTPLESVAMYINFRMRHPHLKPNEEAFKNSLMEDPYFNAIQVKYGYAITGHKSQGGEWKTVYVDYSGRLGLNNDSLRWAYTATTRAVNVLYGVNMPSITPMSSLVFNPILKISKPHKEAFSFENVDDIKLLPPSVSNSQKQKCVWTKQLLDEKGFFLKSIQTFQYNDKYVIETPSGCVTWDCYYNGAGLYTRFCPNVSLEGNEVIRKILEDESGIRYCFDYVPSSSSLNQLFNKMRSVCDDLGIIITNVVEHTNQYNVCYYLKTSSKFSSVMFYFKVNMAITHALPSSETGPDDDKLQQLIEHFK